MSACPTCKSLEAQMPSRIVIHVDGTTYTQSIGHSTKERDLQAACNYLLSLIEQERAKGQSNG